METTQAFDWYLPMMFHLDSQDDKIFPKHLKFNPKLNLFPITLKMNNMNEKFIQFI